MFTMTWLSGKYPRLHGQVIVVFLLTHFLSVSSASATVLLADGFETGSVNQPHQNWSVASQSYANFSVVNSGLLSGDRALTWVNSGNGGGVTANANSRRNFTTSLPANDNLVTLHLDVAIPGAASSYPKNTLYIGLSQWANSCAGVYFTTPDAGDAGVKAYLRVRESAGVYRTITLNNVLEAGGVLNQIVLSYNRTTGEVGLRVTNPDPALGVEVYAQAEANPTISSVELFTGLFYNPGTYSTPVVYVDNVIVESKDTGDSVLFFDGFENAPLGGMTSDWWNLQFPHSSMYATDDTDFVINGSKALTWTYEGVQGVNTLNAMARRNFTGGGDVITLHADVTVPGTAASYPKEALWLGLSEWTTTRAVVFFDTPSAGETGIKANFEYFDGAGARKRVTLSDVLQADGRTNRVELSYNRVTGDVTFKVFNPDPTLGADIIRRSQPNLTASTVELFGANGYNKGIHVDPVASVDNVTVVASPDPAGRALAIYDDAEGGGVNGWTRTSGTGSISNVVDPDDSTNRALRIIGGPGLETGYRKNFTDDEIENFVFEWRGKFDDTYQVQVQIRTMNGTRTFLYGPTGSVNGSKSNSYLVYNVGSDTDDNTWHTIRRNLIEDLKRLEPDNDILGATAFVVRGAGYFDDIQAIRAPGEAPAQALVPAIPASLPALPSGERGFYFAGNTEDTAYVAATTTPVIFSAVNFDSSNTTLVLDVPQGIEVLSGTRNFTVQGPVPVNRNGSTFDQYRLVPSGGASKFTFFWRSTSPVGSQHTAYYYAEWPGDRQADQEMTIDVIDLPTNRARFSADVPVWVSYPSDFAEDWGLPEDYKLGGFNAIELWAYYETANAYWGKPSMHSARDLFGGAGLDLIGWTREWWWNSARGQSAGQATLINGNKTNQLDLLYRGTYFEQWKAAGRELIDDGIYAHSVDPEIYRIGDQIDYSAPVKTAFQAYVQSEGITGLATTDPVTIFSNTSQYPQEARAFRKFKASLYTEFFRLYRADMEAHMASEGITEPFEFVLTSTYHRGFDSFFGYADYEESPTFIKTYEDPVDMATVFDVISPMSYTDLYTLGGTSYDMTMAWKDVYSMKQIVGSTPVMPLLSAGYSFLPGFDRDFTAEQLRYSIMESFAGGATGFGIWSETRLTAEDMNEVAHIVDKLVPYESLILDSSPFVSEPVYGGAFVKGVQGPLGTLMLVSDYSDSVRNVVVASPGTGQVKDVETGEVIATVQANQLFGVDLDGRRARMLHIAP